ncbi:MAG: 50S ribosomal protein L17 [Saprospiraceae bacterium]|nr:50S ribosomal protein L17 [Saprospiraceae bacterium]
MRHGKKVNHLSRKAGHRKALLTNMASQLIMHKRIRTTVAKAKALRVFVEPIITRGKEDSTHSRRMAFKYLQSKEAVSELFATVAPKVGDRPGGYVRIIKTGVRSGDAAEMAFIELVDFNEVYVKDDSAKKSKTRRSRRGGKKKAGAEAAVATAATTAAQAKAEAEEAVEDAGEKIKGTEEE